MFAIERAGEPPGLVDEAAALHIRDVPGARHSIVLIHGVMSHAGWLEPLAEALAERGIASVAVDRRGSGRATSLVGTAEPNHWLHDIRVAQAHLRSKGHRVALLGWCWGARLALVSASIDPPDQIFLAAPGLAMAPQIRARAAALAAGTEDPVALPFDVDVFSSDPEVTQRIRADELAWRTQPRSFLAPSRGLLDRAISVLPGLSVPITTLLADSDRIVDNATVERLLAPRQIVRLPGEHALVLEAPALLADRLVSLLAP
ncbi:MAG: alpha/beta fold hydrolase [Polyangia bacterium]